MNSDPHARRPLRPIDPSQLRPQRRVFDVARPGRMPAPSTSRPVVTGMQPTVKDPSVTLHTQRMFGQRPPQSQPASPALDIEPPAAPNQPAINRVGHTIAPPRSVTPPPKSQPRLPSAPSSPDPRLDTTMLRRPAASPAVPLRQQSAPPAARQGSVSNLYPKVPGDDIAAGVGPMHLNEEPVLISKHVPKDENKKWRWVIAVAILFFIALIIFDILLDADFITMHQVPHTHFF